ncbi:MAG: hypothetical protein K6B72_02375 [Lachnospiraceae bacterium]|nr:hypothetical protein [Lachnospiraceae bacterium]
MMDELDPDEIHDRAEESREQVRRSLKLLELPEEVQDKLISKGVKENRPH